MQPPSDAELWTKIVILSQISDLSGTERNRCEKLVERKLHVINQMKKEVEFICANVNAVKTQPKQAENCAEEQERRCWRAIRTYGVCEIMSFKRKVEKMFDTRSWKYVRVSCRNIKINYLKLWMLQTKLVVTNLETTLLEGVLLFFSSLDFLGTFSGKLPKAKIF